MDVRASKVVHGLQQKSNYLKPIRTEELKKLQSVLSKILSDVYFYANQIGVQVILCGGSCLGAVRHKGFIPWDDDVDIAISRKDWEVFKNCFEEYLGDDYILNAPGYNNEDSCFLWGKIYLKDSKLVTWLNENLPYPQKISIDVFIIENVPNSWLVQRFDAFITTIIKYATTSMLFYQYPNPIMRKMFGSSLKGKTFFLFRQTIGFLFSIVSHKKWLNYYNSFITRHKNETHMTTIPTGTGLYLGERMKRSEWYPCSKGKFGNIDVLLPNNPDKYLKNLYGFDYMTLPPVEKRESHYVISIKFPDQFGK